MSWTDRGPAPQSWRLSEWDRVPCSVMTFGMMNAWPIQIPESRIADLCQKRRIREFALFGSVLRDDFDPTSDVDVLVSFD